MKNMVVTVLIVLLLVMGLMFTEYRFIMHNIRPYLGKRNTVYLEFFGRTDEYYAERIE